MEHSESRILSTHVGSLPRSDELVSQMFAKLQGKPVNEAELEQLMSKVEQDIVKKQLDTGIDVINDGEVRKISYVTYVKERFSGFSGQADDLVVKDVMDYPEAGAALANDPGMQHLLAPACEGPVALTQPGAVYDDIAALQKAIKGSKPAGAFMTAASPGAIAMFMTNRYYSSHEDYIGALSDAMSYEYKAVVDAGFILQVDCPDLGSIAHVAFPFASPEEHKRYVELHVEAVNAALKGLPSEQLRLHVCWGNNPGPHHHDIEFREIVSSVLKARPACLLVEAANPRHEHEWEVFSEIKLPEEKIIVPGVVDTTNNYIEHPDLVAQRIMRYADQVGRENVMAGSDCGFSTLVGMQFVEPAIAWKKLEVLVEGARRATAKLWR